MTQNFIDVSPWRVVTPKINSKKELNEYIYAFKEWLNLRPIWLDNFNLAFSESLIKKIDFSIDSLKPLGEYIYNNHSKEEMIKGENVSFFDFCARYIGEVLIRNYANVEWYISFNKKEFAYLRPAIKQYLTEPLNEVYRVFSNENPYLIYENVVQFKTILEIDNLIINSKFLNKHFDTYENFILIASNSNFEIISFIEKVKNALQYKNYTLEIEDNRFYFKIDDWVLWLTYNENDSILEESQEMAEMVKDEEKRKKIATCSKRIEMIATDDPNMDYFNEHLYILEAAQEFTDVFVFSPHSGFM
ncbi:MAG: hypothetical protein U5N85_05480 [Arcicella sp.]|nr:hypothetical protein [Arcicella sp.]